MIQALVLSILILLSGCSSREKPRFVEIEHSLMKISYDPNLKLARYVVYELKKDNLLKRKFKRKDRFKGDPYLEAHKIPQVSGDVYRRSGYDRGHLAPAADFSWSQRALEESFYFTNIAPQKPGLNRGSWKRLEERVRRWACGEERLTVITGPLLDSNPQFIKNELLVPQSFFKIVVDETPPKRARAFIYLQESEGDEVELTDPRLSKIHDAYPGILNLQRNPAATGIWKEKNCSR